MYIQPTKTTIKKTKGSTTKKKVGTTPRVVVDGYRDTYDVGNHYIYFKLPVTNPIYQLTIDEGETQNTDVQGNQILWDISYNGDDFNNDFLIGDMGNGAGNYDLSLVRPTFVTIRANLKNTNKYTTPILRSCQFIVHTDPAKKAYVRGLPYCPESETMLPACIWSEVNAKYESDEKVDVNIDIVREVEAQQNIRIRRDTLDDLWEYYSDYYPTKQKSDFTDASFRIAIQKDTDFIEYLKTLPVPVYVVSVYPFTNPNYYNYFIGIELRHFPAYPLLSCDKILGEETVKVEQFVDSNYDVNNTKYTLDMGRDLSSDMVNILFQQPTLPEEGEEDRQEGVVENMLVYDSGYTDANGFTDNTKDYALTSDKRGIIFNLNGENFTKNVVFESNGQIKCFKLDDGTIEGVPDVIEDDYHDPNIVDADTVGLVAGDVVELAINLRDKSYTEHLNYDVDYNNKILIPKASMKKDLSKCDLLIKYNPLWVRDLTSDNLPLKMDLWVESFVMSDEYRTEDDKIVYYTKVAPRDNLREVVLWDDEETLIRNELEEDVDFVVDYQNNKIIFDYPIENDTPVTIRYTPNLTDTSLSIAYRMDRTDVNNQAYIYGNYFTTRT